jgi:hypothetical protein
MKSPVSKGGMKTSVLVMALNAVLLNESLSPSGFYLRVSKILIMKNIPWSSTTSSLDGMYLMVGLFLNIE